MKTRYIRYGRILKHTIMFFLTQNIVHWYEAQHYFYVKYFKPYSWFNSYYELQNKIQKCYTEIWKTQMYPLSMLSKPKADDILKKQFPFLKPE